MGDQLMPLPEGRFSRMAALTTRASPAYMGIPLRGIANPSSRRLAGAIRRGRRGALTPEERLWTGRIEGMRSVVQKSKELVPDKATEPRTVGEIARRASQAPSSATLLFTVVRALRPLRCVELGTCVGVSTAYQAAALALNGAGELVTLEGYATLARVATANLLHLGLDDRVEVQQGKFNALLDDVLGQAPVDYAFIDGNHRESATLDYHRRFLAVARDQAVLVFDDIAWSSGMERAWHRISRHPQTEWATAVGRLGFCVVRSS